jgi:CheY-like chemotaxis protein
MKMEHVFGNDNLEMEVSGNKAFDPLQVNPDLYRFIVLASSFHDVNAKEFMKMIRRDMKLKEIPIVVLISKDEKSEEYESLGAIHAFDLYLMKLKGKIDYLKDNEETKINPLDVVHEEVKLGKGTEGEVFLIRSNISRGVTKQYARKDISLIGLDENQVEKAKREVQIMMKLDGPTVIRYYDSVLTKDWISVIMEYEDGGNLQDKICKLKGVK